MFQNGCRMHTSTWIKYQKKKIKYQSIILLNKVSVFKYTNTRILILYCSYLLQYLSLSLYYQNYTDFWEYVPDGSGTRAAPSPDLQSLACPTVCVDGRVEECVCVCVHEQLLLLLLSEELGRYFLHLFWYSSKGFPMHPHHQNTSVWKKKWKMFFLIRYRSFTRFTHIGL